MTLVRAGSLLNIWSGVMPSAEVDSEYNVLFLILNMRVDILTSAIFCIPLNAPSDVLFYILYGNTCFWLLISLWFPFLDNVLT